MKRIFNLENTLGDKIKITLIVKQRRGNETFRNFNNKINKAIGEFTDIKFVRNKRIIKGGKDE